MSDMKFNCPECNGALEVEESAGGRLVNCPQCQKQIRIPNKTPAVTAAAPMPASQPPLVTQEQKACPFCGEMILAVAKKCKHCGEMLGETVDSVKVPDTSAINHKASEVNPSAGEKKCSVCGGTIPVLAVQCKHCGNALNKPPKKAVVAYWLGLLTSIILLLGGCVMYNISGCAAALTEDKEASAFAGVNSGIFWLAVFGIAASVGIKKMKGWGWKLQFSVAGIMWLLMMAWGSKPEYIVGNIFAVSFILSPLFISAILAMKAMKERAAQNQPV